MGQRIFAVIASGQAVSGDIDLSKAALRSVFVPTITSGDLFLRGSYDQTSANFVRVQQTLPNTGDLRWGSGVGSLMLPYPTTFPSPAFGRLETSVAQTDTRTFVLIAN